MIVITLTFGDAYHYFGVLKFWLAGCEGRDEKNCGGMNGDGH